MLGYGRSLPRYGGSPCTYPLTTSQLCTRQGAVEGLDALSDTAIGTGLSLAIKRLASLPEEKAVGADLLKAEAFIEPQWSSSILSRAK